LKSWRICTIFSDVLDRDMLAFGYFESILGTGLLLELILALLCCIPLWVNGLIEKDMIIDGQYIKTQYCFSREFSTPAVLGVVKIFLIAACCNFSWKSRKVWKEYRENHFNFFFCAWTFLLLVLSFIWVYTTDFTGVELDEVQGAAFFVTIALMPTLYLLFLWQRRGKVDTQDFTMRQEQEMERELLLRVKSMNTKQFEEFHMKYMNVGKEKIMEQGLKKMGTRIGDFILGGRDSFVTKESRIAGDDSEDEVDGHGKVQMESL